MDMIKRTIVKSYPRLGKNVKNSLQKHKHRPILEADEDINVRVGIATA